MYTTLGRLSWETLLQVQGHQQHLYNRGATVDNSLWETVGWLYHFLINDQGPSWSHDKWEILIMKLCGQKGVEPHRYTPVSTKRGGLCFSFPFQPIVMMMRPQVEKTTAITSCTCRKTTKRWGFEAGWLLPQVHSKLCGAEQPRVPCCRLFSSSH